MEQMIDELIEEWYEIEKVNWWVPQGLEVADRFGVMSTPTFVFVINMEEWVDVIKTIHGMTTKEELLLYAEKRI